MNLFPDPRAAPVGWASAWRRRLAFGVAPPAFWDPARQQVFRPLVGDWASEALAVTRHLKRLPVLAAQHDVVVWDRANPFPARLAHQEMMFAFMQARFADFADPRLHSFYAAIIDAGGTADDTARSLLKNLQRPRGGIFRSRVVPALPPPLRDDVAQMVRVLWDIHVARYGSGPADFNLRIDLRQTPMPADMSWHTDGGQGDPTLPRLLVTYWGSPTHYTFPEELPKDIAGRPLGAAASPAYWRSRRGALVMHRLGYIPLWHSEPNRGALPRLLLVLDATRRS